MADNVVESSKAEAVAIPANKATKAKNKNKGKERNAGSIQKSVEPFDLRKVHALLPGTTFSVSERATIDEIVAKYVSEESALAKIQLLEQYIRQLTRKAATSGRNITQLVCEVCDELSLQANKYKGENAKKVMEDAAVVISQFFRVTVSDFHTEKPLTGRTMECYRVACLLLQIYVRIEAFPLTEGIVRAIQQYRPHIPPLSSLDFKTQVQYTYYEALMKFRDHKFKDAADLFSKTLEASTTAQGAMRLNGLQLAKIMRLYIPAQYIAYNRAPSQDLIELIPDLKSSYGVIISACREGNYRKFNDAFEGKNEQFLKKRKVYLPFKSCIPRLRLNLLRRVWLLEGKPKRISLKSYAKALELSGFEHCDLDAAEFYCAQFIANGEVNGYVHHELKLLLISSTKPFPTLVKPIQKTQ